MGGGVLILGIETATEQVSCAVGGHEGVLALFEVARGRRHAELLTPAIEFICRQADVTLDEIGAIAVDVGPGLFTGMRVGIATAKAMAHALRVPVIPIASVDLLAFPLRHADRLIAAVVDARRDEVYFAFYRQVPGGVQRLIGPVVGSVDDLIGELLATGEEALCVGDGALRHRDAISTGARRIEFAEQWLAHPSAAPLVQLAHAKALREDWVAGSDVEPVYLRKPDAQINWSTRESAAVGARPGGAGGGEDAR
jgi:tRNA threonylcarbamoyladenosine biosynthesis protein TsaB